MPFRHEAEHEIYMHSHFLVVLYKEYLVPMSIPTPMGQLIFDHARN